MSMLSPTSREEIERSSWFFAAFFILPFVLLIAFWWGAYPSAHVRWVAVGAAVLLSLPATVWIVRRAKRLAEQGIHPYYSKTRPPPVRKYFLVWLGALLVVYMWASAATAALVWLPSHAASEQSFVVSEVRQRNRKFLGCYREAKFASWPGSSIGSVCVDSIDPEVQPGQRLVVRGRFSLFGVYVQSIHREKAG